MQDRYAGDIGDFAKLGLLRALCGKTAEDGDASLSLGVIWYLNQHANEKNDDGKYLQYLAEDHRERRKFRSLDRHLFDGMARLVEGSRSVGRLWRYLPRPNRNYGEPLTYVSRRRKERLEERAVWFRRAMVEVDGTDVVFVDPDNGIRPKSVEMHHVKAAKYVDIQELRQIWDRGQSLVVYHHLNRKEKTAEQIAERLEELRNGLSTVVIHAPVFKRWSRRAFFVIPQSQHRAVMESRLEVFLDRWADHV